MVGGVLPGMGKDPIVIWSKTCLVFAILPQVAANDASSMYRTVAVSL